MWSATRLDHPLLESLEAGAVEPKLQPSPDLVRRQLTEEQNQLGRPA